MEIKKKTSASTDFSVFRQLKQRWQWNPGWDGFQQMIAGAGWLCLKRHHQRQRLMFLEAGLTASPEEGERSLTLASTALASLVAFLPPYFLSPRLSVASCLPREKAAYVIKQWLATNLSLSPSTSTESTLLNVLLLPTHQSYPFPLHAVKRGTEDDDMWLTMVLGGPSTVNQQQSISQWQQCGPGSRYPSSEARVQDYPWQRRHSWDQTSSTMENCGSSILSTPVTALSPRASKTRCHLWCSHLPGDRSRDRAEMKHHLTQRNCH